ncbi:Oxidoreductase OS=Streptomyces antimycoticus OX=68175 GN=SSPO_045650 PE=4 SV=1 [Streptomyces antimycoticus]
MTSQVSSPAEQAEPADQQGGQTPAGGQPAAEGGKEVRRLDRVIIRFAGDSGDGMQLTGDRFTSETASFGNDLSTLPNFPAEIRAPAGTLPGVSSFQLHFADHDILTPGDAPNVLVAMNPAALKANLPDVPRGAEIIVNTDEFTKRPMAKVGYDQSPLEDGSLDGYHVHPVPLTTLTIEALKEFGLSRKEAERSKNMFALGLLSWMYHRPTEGTEKFLRQKFAKKPQIAEANVAAFRAGWNFGETTEDFAVSYEVAPATRAFPTGTYRNISGNLALSYGLIAASRQADLPLFLGGIRSPRPRTSCMSCPSTRTSVCAASRPRTKIAGIGAALGAAFGGSLAVTTTSGPGVALKSETIGLAVSLELPLLVIDIQRGGPSTGLPTKTEQADLLQAMYGRNGEAPVPIVAPKTPADCFDAALDAARIALTYHPGLPAVGRLSGQRLGALAGAGRRRAARPPRPVRDRDQPCAGRRHRGLLAVQARPQDPGPPWAVPGTPGLEHGIGGIEKQDGSGNISYDPANHEHMVRIRQAKVDGITVPDIEVDDPTGDARTLVLGWGSTYGPITAAVRRVRTAGDRIAQAHLRHLNPFPANLGTVLEGYEKVVVPEMNLGQLATLLRPLSGRRPLLHPGPRAALKAEQLRHRPQGGHR